MDGCLTRFFLSRFDFPLPPPSAQTQWERRLAHVAYSHLAAEEAPLPWPTRRIGAAVARDLTPQLAWLRQEHNNTAA